MSTILKGNILNVGQLENEIFNALNFYGCGFDYTGPTDQCEAQREYANRLANAISNGVSKGVQQYLLQTVTTNPNVSSPSGGTIHVHALIPDTLNAP
jgi:hypothetical protein